MERRDFLRIVSSGVTCSLLSGCGYLRIDPFHFLIRSDQITSFEQEREIVGRAGVSYSEDGRIRVLHTRGTHYECGYQHGALLRDEVQENLGYLYEQSLKKFRSRELFAEAYERLRPFIPQKYIDEMHGLAHGSRLPLEVVHHVHALPSITEWGGKKRLKKIVKEMIAGGFGTSCSNIGVQGRASADGSLYAVRVLDWGLHRISKLHEYPLIWVSQPEGSVPFVNIGWIGFLGAVSGMNAEGITLGEMGYKDPPNETLRGKPMPFLLRDILGGARNLADVRSIIQGSPGTNSFAFLMTDGKSGEAELYVRDRNRFEVKKPGVEVVDRDMTIPAINNVSYGGHYEDRMAEVLSEHRGRITPELLMEKVIPDIAMKSNFQNVVYDPVRLRFWVNNAAGPKARAAEQPYTFFDFGKALKE
jgi:hypothetical protein